MAAPKPVPYPHIVRRADILSGEPIIAESRIPVRVVVQTADYARSKDELYGAHPTVSPEAIEEALAYYAAHRSEIDWYISANEEALVTDEQE